MKYFCEKLDFGVLCVILLVNALFMFFITEFFTVNKLTFWKEGTGILVSLVLVCSIVIGGVWALATTLSDIQSKLSALNERVGGLEKRLGNLEVGVQSINEYLRQSNINVVPGDASTSYITGLLYGKDRTSVIFKPASTSYITGLLQGKDRTSVVFKPVFTSGITSLPDGRNRISVVFKLASTSGISQVPKGQVFQDTSPPYKPPPAIMP